MICIHSNEKLVFQNLLEAFHQIKVMPQFFYSDSDNSIWLEIETLSGMVTNKQKEESLHYYFVVDSGMDFVDMYAHLKMIWQLAKGFVTSHLFFHVIIAFANQQISETEQLNNKAKDLFCRLNHLNGKKKSTFNFQVFTHFAYNLFGDSKFVSINESSVIQQFININNDSMEGLYLTINPKLLLTGTDVKLFCAKLIKEHGTVTKSSEPNIYANTLLMPKLIQLQELIAKLKKGTFIIEEVSANDDRSLLVQKQMNPFINWESEVSLTDQIMNYIK